MSTVRLCLKVQGWPTRDRIRWTSSAVPKGLFDDAGAASEWSERTRDKVERGYGRWLRWLADHGQLDLDQPPGAHMKQEMVRAYLTELGTTWAPYTLMNRAQELYDAMRVLAPERDWKWLSRLSTTLQMRAKPVSNKRERLRTPGELIALGRTLMARAEAAPEWCAQRRAVLFRDGLMIAVLASRPIRMKNLSSMRLGTHLVNVSGTFWLVFAGSEMKAKQPYEAGFPEALAPALTRYLDHHRPVLLMGENRSQPAMIDALWVAEMGTQLEQGALARRITKHTRIAFGASIPPHWFRDAAATEIAISNPECVDDIRHLLGHASPKTAERHYNQARSLTASRRYLDAIAYRQMSD